MWIDGVGLIINAHKYKFAGIEECLSGRVRGFFFHFVAVPPSARLALAETNEENPVLR